MVKVMTPRGILERQELNVRNTAPAMRARVVAGQRKAVALRNGAGETVAEVAI
jgi:hypothetical protein